MAAYRRAFTAIECPVLAGLRQALLPPAAGQPKKSRVVGKCRSTLVSLLRPGS